MFQCNYCKNHFQSIAILNKHQKNDKRCLDMQFQKPTDSLGGEIRRSSLEDAKNGENNCKYCSRSFSGQKVLSCHNAVCPEKYKQEIQAIRDEYECRIEELKGMIVSMSKREKQYKEEIAKYQDLLIKTNQNFDHLMEQHIEETYCKE
jgi:hypothetical protein